MKLKKILGFLLGPIFLASLSVFVFNKIEKPKDNIAYLRQRHEQFLKNSPFKETLKLSKKERKAKGLPPNKYMERQWELTMNPVTGKPESEKLFALQEQLRENALFAKVPGENTNNWVERGPNNVGGRTRAIMFDPNDATNKRVFAGGVSGGLWVNNDITNANSAWTEVNIPQNLAISSITFDPNNPNIFYVGTGESYVQGSVNGNGLWQSTNGGANWVRVFGGVTGETTFQSNAKLTVNSPGSIAGEYVLAGASFGPALSTITGNLVLVDDGTSLPTEGCNALTNGGAINGNIAVIERGNCNFTTKVLNAQAAGAIAVLVVNNAVGPPIVQGGTDPGTITIPSVMISKNEGQAIMAQLGVGVNATMDAVSSPVSGRFVTPGIHHINDVKVRDMGNGNSEVYVAAASVFFTDANPSSLFGVEDYGLYKSLNNGSTWAKVNLPATSGGSNYVPNDIEVSANNTLWVSTNANIYGDGGGTILSSTNGNTFTVKKTILNGDRTQIAVSKTDPNKIFVLAELSSGTNGVSIVRTLDGFSTDISLPLPKDIDTDIPPTDFTNGQGFYDLVIEVDPTNDQIVYVGGIDLFRTTNGGSSWIQISEYYTNTGLSNVHPDQHAIVFNPSNPTIAVNGNDGGVYYATSLSTTPVIRSRNKNYNTVQFYNGAIGPEVAPNERFLGGAQDNGTNWSGTATTTGINSFTRINGGDGAYVFIDKDKSYMISSYLYNSYYYHDYSNPFNASSYTIVEDQNSGDFINPTALDDTNNILYANGSSGSTYQINRYILGTGSATASNMTDALLTGSPTAFKPSTFNPSTLFVGTDNGRLLKITNANGAASWVDITGDDFYGSISCIELGSTENDIFVTFFNYGINNIYYSSDAGATWQSKEGNIPDLPVRAIMMNPLNSNEVIIGTDLGVWATYDFSVAFPIWSQSQNGMKDVPVTSFDLRTVDNTVLASTYGRGVFSGAFILEPNGDIDGDGVLNGVDICPQVANADQADSDGNGIGDVCQDTDKDSVLDINDNCPNNSNLDQKDSDGDGIGDVCQDSDNDGVPDANDNCINVANIDQKDTNGNGIGDVCDISYENPENITLEVISETCPGSENGTIIIKTQETYVTYTATLIGDGINLAQGFDTSYTFEDIKVGSYTVCVSVDNKMFEQCFEINIAAAESLDAVFGKSGKNKSDVTSIIINKGTPPFNIIFNGKIIRTTSEYAFEIETLGSGILEIVSSKACEGVASKMINNTDFRKVVASPNPVLDVLKITLPSIENEQISVQIYSINGNLLFNQTINKGKSDFIEIPFKKLNKGFYFVKVNIEKPMVFKILK